MFVYGRSKANQEVGLLTMMGVHKDSSASILTWGVNKDIYSSRI